MAQIAKIAIEAATFAIDKPYDYLVPDGMEVRAGMRVIVPFGRETGARRGWCWLWSPDCRIGH